VITHVCVPSARLYAHCTSAAVCADERAVTVACEEALQPAQRVAISALIAQVLRPPARPPACWGNHPRGSQPTPCAQWLGVDGVGLMSGRVCVCLSHTAGGAAGALRPRGGGHHRVVSAPSPSFVRPVLTEIHLCHACSCQEILRTETARQGCDGGAARACECIYIHRDSPRRWPFLCQPRPRRRWGALIMARGGHCPVLIGAAVEWSARAPQHASPSVPGVSLHADSAGGSTAPAPVGVPGSDGADPNSASTFRGGGGS
jgi:hypothetical protein